MNRISIKLTDAASRQTDVLNLGTNLTVDQITDSIVNLVENGKPVDYLAVLQNIDEVFSVNTSEDSSFVEKISYNFFTKKMEVELTSGVYDYDNVDPATFLSFVNADSKGQFFNRYLRTR